ncbi:MAG: hypothetical protein V4754_18075 [Pseudomonadota bacterium]
MSTLGKYWSARPLAWCCLLLASLTACGGGRTVNSEAGGNPARVAPARASQTYVFQPGQSMAITPGTTLTLERVNDSRCRPGAVCVWAGYISYSFSLVQHGARSAFVLSDSMPGAASTIDKDGLRYALLSVEPAAPPALHAGPPDYRVTLRVAIQK